MKRIIALWVFCVICLAAGGPGMADGTPAGYPAVKIDPDTGTAYDFGGRTVYIQDFFSASSDIRSDDPTAEEAALYEYRDWIMSTYNCHIVQAAMSDWGSIAEDFADFAEDPDGSLRIYLIPADFLAQVTGSGAVADWNTGLVDLTDGHWNSGTVDMTTVGSSTYGVSVGKTEPRQMLYFNKRVLNEAGIDWNELYDLQDAGNWTWSSFTSVLQQVQRDIDNDGILDVFGMTGSSSDFYRIAVFANGGSFFAENEYGELVPTSVSQSSATVQALDWARSVWADYSMPQPENSSWDWYNQAWLQGRCAFFMGQGYQGFGGGFSGLADEWGALAFPVGPAGNDYVTVASDNVTVIPDVYDARTTAMLTMIYDLWTRPTPGYEEDESTIAGMLAMTDERAVGTYAMLRENGHCVVDKVYLLGNPMDLEDSPILWQLESYAAADLLEAAVPRWQEVCEGFNEMYGPDVVLFTCEDGVLSIHGKGPLPAERSWAEFASVATVVDITGSITALCDHAFDGFSLVTEVCLPQTLQIVNDYAFSGCAGVSNITIPKGVTTIGEGAFNDCAGLETVVIPRTVTQIGDDAFAGCTGLDYVTYGGSPSEWSLIVAGTDDDSLAGLNINCMRADKTPIVPDDFVFLHMEAGQSAWFSYTPEEGGNLLFFSAGDADVVCEMYVDQNGEEILLASDDNVGGQGGFSIVRKVEAGVTYYYAVRFLSDGIAEVTLEAVPGPSWSLEDGVLTISGSGEMEDYSWNNTWTEINAPWYQERHQIRSIVIGDGVTRIGNYAFYGSSAESVTLGDQVVSIGEYAFDCNYYLTAVHLPASVSDIGSGAFLECNDLEAFTVDADNRVYTAVDGSIYDKDVTMLLICPPAKESLAIPEGVTSFDHNAFSGCNRLTGISIPASLDYVPYGTFMYSTPSLNSLTVAADNPFYTSVDNVLYDKDITTLIKASNGLRSVVIPDTVTCIGEGAFYGSSVTSLDIPDGVTDIYNEAFAHCSLLSSVTLPAGITVIPDFLFISCRHLEEVTVPAGVYFIGFGAFMNCDSLTDVFYAGTENDWTQIDIGEENDSLINAAIRFGSQAENVLTLPAQLIVIESGAFTGLPNVTAIRIPDGVQMIDEDAFDPGMELRVPAGSPWVEWAEDNGYIAVEE